MKRRAQSMLEYMVLLAIVAAAVIGMQVYLKRGILGRQRVYADQLGVNGYSPRRTSGVTTVYTNIVDHNRPATSAEVDDYNNTYNQSANYEEVTFYNSVTTQVTNRRENVETINQEPLRW